MTTFDRYVLRRYWHVFIVSFLAMMGLYIVIDAFNNVDDFFRSEEAGTFEVMLQMVRYYAFRSCQFFDSIGSIVSVTAVTVVLSLVLRHGELNPILSAGVPTYRLVFPLLWGTVMVAVVMIANKELVIPRIADELQKQAGKTGDEVEGVELVRDYSTKIDFDGETLIPSEKKLIKPAFVIPAPKFTPQTTAITGSEAYYLKAGPNRPLAGWMVKNADTDFDDLQLTPLARETISPGPETGDIFVATEVGSERLYRPDAIADLISTPELIRRIKSPAYDPLAVRSHSLNLHQRFTRPVMDVILIFLVMPLIVRREARGLVVSMALSGLMLGTVFGIGQGFLWLGRSNVIGPDLAAWGPVIAAGSLATWCWPMLRT